MDNNEKITFIIPTIGRDSLKNTIDSLLNQTVKEWNAIIIFDGINSNIKNIDHRIKVIEIDKKGLDINSAGFVRNCGISSADTKWIAFIDDDDTISNDYIETFHKELYDHSVIDLDLIIFRMKMNDRIIPKLDTDNFYLCDVGISYIMKKKIFDNGVVFKADGAEDFLHLDDIRSKGYKIMISPYVKYFVRGNSEYNISNNEVVGKRVFINVENKYINFIGYFLMNYYNKYYS